MDQTPNQLRMAENELVFRQHNEKIEKGFNEINKLAMEDGQEGMIVSDDSPLLFYCECSDENCHERIKLKPSRYQELHKKHNQFVVLNGHEKPEIERVTRREEDISVVEKYIEPPQSATALKSTN